MQALDCSKKYLITGGAGFIGFFFIEGIAGGRGAGDRS